MTPDEARAFLRDNHQAVLATFRRDGRPQLSPVGAGIDDEGRVEISSRETAMKVKNQPEALDLLVGYYRRISGEHPDWDEYRQAMVDEKRVLVRFAIDRAGPTVEG